MAKVGRPKADNPKDERITLRLREEEMHRLSVYAEKMGITKSQAMEKALELLFDQEREKE